MGWPSGAGRDAGGARCGLRKAPGSPAAALVVAEVALAVVLTAGAGLMGRSR